MRAGQPQVVFPQGQLFFHSGKGANFGSPPRKRGNRQASLAYAAGYVGGGAIAQKDLISGLSLDSVPRSMVDNTVARFDLKR